MMRRLLKDPRLDATADIRWHQRLNVADLNAMLNAQHPQFATAAIDDQTRGDKADQLPPGTNPSDSKGARIPKARTPKGTAPKQTPKERFSNPFHVALYGETAAMRKAALAQLSTSDRSAARQQRKHLEREGEV